MADAKISALPASTTPLAGTETLPIVQSGVTKKVSVADLTAGRAVASAGGTFSDDYVQGTAGKGVNFTANTPAAGMTSQLLNWYEEGTWTPSLGGNATYNGRQGFYTRIGRTVYVSLDIDVNVIGSGAASRITNLPYTPKCNTAGSIGFYNNAANTVVWGGVYVVGNDANLYFTGNAASGAASSNWNIFGNSARVIASIAYTV